MPPAGFEPAIPAGDLPQTLALDRSATGIGDSMNLITKIHGMSNIKVVTRTFAFVLTNLHFRDKHTRQVFTMGLWRGTTWTFVCGNCTWYRLQTKNNEENKYLTCNSNLWSAFSCLKTFSFVITRRTKQNLFSSVKRWTLKWERWKNGSSESFSRFTISINFVMWEKLNEISRIPKFLFGQCAPHATFLNSSLSLLLYPVAFESRERLFRVSRF